MTIRPATKADAPLWEAMRHELWPADGGGHHYEVEQYFAASLLNPVEVLLAFTVTGEAVGFVELSIRNIVDSCTSGRVAYLEGWFVKADERGKGIGSALVQAAEEWGRRLGCTELASDTEISNELSAAMHKALGFEETDRVIQFRKDL